MTHSNLPTLPNSSEDLPNDGRQRTVDYDTLVEGYNHLPTAVRWAFQVEDLNDYLHLAYSDDNTIVDRITEADSRLIDALTRVAALIRFRLYSWMTQYAQLKRDPRTAEFFALWDKQTVDRHSRYPEGEESLLNEFVRAFVNGDWSATP